MPRLVLRKFSKVRSNNPALVRSASESAISPATSVLRIQFPWRAAPECKEPLDFRASLDSTEEDCTAGASPNKAPAATQTRKVNAKGTRPTRRGLGCGKTSVKTPRNRLTLAYATTI